MKLQTIESIEEVGIEEVWDISMLGNENFFEGEPNFIAQDILVHNCHAAGVLISPIPLARIAPMHVTRTAGVDEDGKPERVMATQFPMEDVERMGLIKFDVLGLETATAIDWACKYIREEKGVEINWKDVGLNDSDTLNLLHSGKTDGCFQLEHPGMKECLRMIGIDSFNDLVVAVAMYRPGPKDYIPEFAGRKQGTISVSYPHPLLKSITESTHGIICFQENTLISMADGSEKPIKQVKMDDKVHSVNLGTGQVEIKECHGCEETKPGEGMLVSLENGYKLLVTPDHEILTYYGMREVQDLVVGKDIVACPLSTPSLGVIDSIAPWLGADELVAYLLGQLTGDGNIHRGCSLSCGLKDACDSVEEWIKDRIPKLKIHKYFHGSWHLGISCDELQNSDSGWDNVDEFNPDLREEIFQPKIIYGNRKTKFHVLLENTGLKTNCYFKSVPLQILKHKSDRVKSSYLAGLFDSDGSITKSVNGFAICHYTSQSPELINGVRKLLQLLGISHQVRTNRVHVWDTDKLCQCIDEFLVIRSFPEKLTKGKYSSRVPYSKLRDLKDKEHLSEREFYTKYGVSRSTQRSKKEFICYGTAEKCGITSGHLRYYHITSIEKIPEQKFWGISVSEHHNLIANGIVAKNCYQEQVMQAFMALADLTASDGYSFMKGCAKKKPKIIQGYKKKFFQGAEKQGIAVNVVQNIWNDLEKFAGYSFNKSLQWNEKIITTKQEYSIQELYNIKQRGEALPQVFSPVGEKINILDVYDHGVIPVYEVTFENGSTVSCTLDHKFMTSEGVISSLREILNKNLTIIQYMGVNRDGRSKQELDMQGLSETVRHSSKNASSSKRLSGIFQHQVQSQNLYLSRMLEDNVELQKVMDSQTKLQIMERFENSTLQRAKQNKWSQSLGENIPRFRESRQMEAKDKRVGQSSNTRQSRRDTATFFANVETVENSQYSLATTSKFENNWKSLRIQKIKFLGYEQCYDLEVDSPDHLYCLANGIMTRNSHSVSYAYVSYKTAYLKSHFPTEFMAARLSVKTRRRKFDDVEKYRKDAIKNLNFKILKPSLNDSKLNWVIAGDKKLLSPLLVKGVGIKAAEEIIKHQPYHGKDLLYTFAMKVGRPVNNKVIEAMVEAGFWNGIKKDKKDTLVEDFKSIRKDRKKLHGRPTDDMFA